MKRMLKEANLASLKKLLKFVSLYRPGSMDLIPDFIHRMHGGDFEYLHPLLEKRTETHVWHYGVSRTGHAGRTSVLVIRWVAQICYAAPWVRKP